MTEQEVLGGLLLGALVVGYFLPTIIAGARSHRQTMAIVALNVPGGWTGIGWLVALVWSCTASVTAEATASRN
jgi:hypothetical protein